MIILGIDPGMAETGWGVIKSGIRNQEVGISDKKSGRNNGLSLVGHGCIKTLVDHNTPTRLLTLKRQLKSILQEYKPDCVAIEQLFFGQNSKTAMIVGQARGVLIVTAAEQKVPVFEYQGLKVKLNLSGFGHSSKKKMQSTVRKLLRLKSLPRPQHASDALAVAIYHALENGQ